MLMTAICSAVVPSCFVVALRSAFMSASADTDSIAFWRAAYISAVQPPFGSWNTAMPLVS